MTAKDFIQKWRHSINHLGLPSVGIHVGWDSIPVDSKVVCLSSKEAWEKIYNCTPPWFKTPQTFKELVISKNTDYLQIVQEETANHKIEYYRNNGLHEPYFCAFAKKDDSFAMLGDGNHRFFDCISLMDIGKDFSNDIERAKLEIIYLKNFEEVLEPEEKIWGQNYNKNEFDLS